MIVQIAEGLGLFALAPRVKWHIQSAVAVTGEGVFEGLDWLASTLKSSSSSSSSSASSYY